VTGTGKKPTLYLAVAGFATGFAALTLYHAWSRVFPPVFASRSLSGMWTGICLLLGILLGSLYFKSRSERLRSRPKLFVFMQVALGIASVLAMRLLVSLAGLPGALASAGGSSAAVAGILGGVLSFGILFVPAFLLSGLLAYGLGSRHFSIFLFLGCALGALGQAFLIAPTGGLWLSCLAGSGIVIVSGLIGFLAARPAVEPETGESGAGMEPGRLIALCYGGYLLSAVLFAVLASRLIFLCAGHTVQASSITAATFFIGLALGSALSVGRLKDRLSTVTWLGAAAGLSGLFGLAISRQAPSLPLTFLSLAGDGATTWSGLLTIYWTLALLWLLLPGILIGSTLPSVAYKTPTRGGQGWGLTAAAAGVLLALLGTCFLPSPEWSLKTLLTLLPWLSIGLGVIMLAMSRAGRGRRVFVIACILLAAAAVTATLPAWNAGILTSGVYVGPARFAETEGLRALLSEAEVIAYGESPGGVISVERTPDAMTVKVNGTVRALTAGNGVSERVSAHIPLLLHDRPRSLLVLGFGTGARLAAAETHPLERISCVEGMHASGRTLRPFASHNRDALRDTRLTMTYADPRHYLSVSNQSHDLILLESPVPFTRHGAELLTAGFFKLLRSRLSAGGMACQAISTADLSPELLGIVARTFTAVFPHVSVWWTGGFDILLVGGMEPHMFDPDTVEMRMAIPSIGEDLARMNITEPPGILALYMTGREEILSLAGGLSSNTVVMNRLACQWPRQTLRRRRGDAFGAAHRTGISPLAVVKPAEGDPSRFEWARDRLDRCADARDLYLRSAEEVASGNVRQGISLLGEAVSTCGLNGTLMFPLSEYYMLLSRRSMDAGRLEDAVESARRAVELDPLGPATFYNLANIELRRDPPTASALLARAIELDPAYIPAYLLKAKAELSEGKPRDATGTVGHVLSVEPFNPTAHQLKGLSLIRRKQYEAGRLELERALEGRPGDLDVMEALAYSWLMEGRLDRARDLYRQVLEAEPERLGALNNYATVLAEEGEYGQAVEAWTRALALSPGNPDIMANIREARQNMRR